MSNFAYRLMSYMFKAYDLFVRIDARIQQFNIQAGMIVVDYGCGPGRYTIPLAKLVGVNGRVYAVDVQGLALKDVQAKAKKIGLDNIETILAEGYNTSIPSEAADIVCALDMFFAVSSPEKLLAEIKRILKPDGLLIIDDGHQSRSVTKKKIASSGFWDIIEETPDHLKCKLRLLEKPA